MYSPTKILLITTCDPTWMGTGTQKIVPERLRYLLYSDDWCCLLRTKFNYFNKFEYLDTLYLTPLQLGKFHDILSRRLSLPLPIRFLVRLLLCNFESFKKWRYWIKQSQKSLPTLKCKNFIYIYLNIWKRTFNLETHS